VEVEELLARVASLQGNARLRTVFGEPIRHGDRMVVAVTQVRGDFGLGFGRGKESPWGGAAGKAECSGQGPLPSSK